MHARETSIPDVPFLSFLITHMAMSMKSSGIVQMDFRRSSTHALSQWAPLLLRLMVGYGFMAHGFAKLLRGLDAFPAIVAAMGIPFPYLMGLSTIAVEILGGFAILAGAYVTLASIPTAVVLLVAMFTVHLPYGFSSVKLLAVTPAGAQFGQPGYETDLLYLACLGALVLGGPGIWAFDNYLARRKTTARADAAA